MKTVLFLSMIKKLHLSPVRDQEQAAAEPAERQTLKTVSANHCHTEVHTQQGRPPLKNKDCDQNSFTAPQIQN